MQNIGRSQTPTAGTLRESSNLEKPGSAAQSSSPPGRERGGKEKPGKKPESPGKIAMRKEAERVKLMQATARKMFGKESKPGLRYDVKVQRVIDPTKEKVFIDEIEQMKEEIEMLKKTAKLCFQCKKNSLKSRNPFRKIQSKIDKRANDLLKSIDFTEVIRKDFPESNLNNLENLLLHPSEGPTPKRIFSALPNALSINDKISFRPSSSSGAESKIIAVKEDARSKASLPVGPLESVSKDGITTSQEIFLFTAKNLPNADGIFGSADPYVVVKWTDDGLSWFEIGKTPVQKKCLNPVWEDMRFEVTPGEKTILQLGSALLVEVWDWDLIGNHNFLGGYVINYEELNIWFNNSNQSVGTIIRKELKLGQLSTLDKSVDQELAVDNKAYIEIGFEASLTVKDESRLGLHVKGRPKSPTTTEASSGADSTDNSGGFSFLGKMRDSLIGRSGSPPPGANNSKSKDVDILNLIKNENELASKDPNKQCFEVQVLSATGLAKADWLLGQSDPYVIVKWNDVEIGRTPHVVKNLNPIWADQKFSLYIPYFEDMSHNSLSFEVWDYDMVGDHDFLGGYEMTGKNLRDWIDEARLGQKDSHDAVAAKRNMSLDKVDYLKYDDQKLAQGVLEIGVKRTGRYRDPFFEVDEESDAANYDESLVLTRHIVDCIFTLKHVLACKRNEKEKLSEGKEDDPATKKSHEEVESLPDIFYRGVASELVKVVINTITKSWGNDGDTIDAVSKSESSSTKKVMDDFFNTSGYILELFPEIFNKSTRPMELNLLHLAVKYSPSHTVARVIRLLSAFDPKMACYIDENFQTPLHYALQNKNTTIEVINLLLEANPAALETRDIKGLLPIHIACATDEKGEYLNFEIIKSLVERYPMALHAMEKKGRLPLHIVAANDPPNFDLLTLLINKYPASVLVGCDAGWLPLHRLVCRNPPVDILKLVMNAPADVPVVDAPYKVRNNKGQLPIHIFCDMIKRDPLIGLTLMDRYPEGLLVADNNKYLPIHIICDNLDPDYDLLLLLARGSTGLNSLSTGVPGGILPSGFKAQLLPLHFLVGMASKPNYGVCTLIAALFPQAIHTGEFRNTKNEGFSWSPYSKAKERMAFGLIAEFDKILNNESYRQGIVKSYQDSILAIVDEIYNNSTNNKTKNNNNSNNNNNMINYSNSSNSGIEGGSFIGKLEDSENAASNVQIYENSADLSGDGGSVNSGSANSIALSKLKTAADKLTRVKNASSAFNKSSTATGRISTGDSVKSDSKLHETGSSPSKAAPYHGQQKVEKSVYARSAVSELYSTLYVKEDENLDEGVALNRSISGESNYDAFSEDDAGVQSKVYNYKKPVTLKSITGASRALGAFSPHKASIAEENVNSDTNGTDLPNVSSRSPLIKPSPLTDPLSVRKFCDGAFEASKKKKEKSIKVTTPIEVVSPPESPIGSKINQKDVSATMKRLKEMGLLPPSDMEKKSAKNKNLIEIHKYLCDFEDTDEYVPRSMKKKKGNKFDDSEKLPEVKQMQSFVDGSIARANLEKQAKARANMIQTDKFIFTPSAVDQREKIVSQDS